jgi:hypothetical protein
VTKPRRKKTWMLLRGFSGTFIVVERKWYDFTGIAKQQGSAWKIAAQHDDKSVLETMASLTGKFVALRVNRETIDETIDETKGI